MKSDNQVKSVLTCSETISYISSRLDSNKDINRTGLAKLLCEHYGLYDPRGVPQKDSCLEVLRELERSGHIVLPARYNKSEISSQGRLAEPVPPPQDVPVNVSEIHGLKLIHAETDEQKLIWKEMMTREHPQGAGPLSDLWLQYLVDSDHGFLGAMAFSPVALIL